jgi:hypothetical protein
MWDCPRGYHRPRGDGRVTLGNGTELGVTLGLGVTGGTTLGSSTWVSNTSGMVCVIIVGGGTLGGKTLGTGLVSTVGAGNACGGANVGAEFGGTGGASVYWWEISASCRRWDCFVGCWLKGKLVRLEKDDGRWRGLGQLQ